MNNRFLILFLLLSLYNLSAHDKGGNIFITKHEDSLKDKLNYVNSKNDSIIMLEAGIIPLKIGNRWIYSAESYEHYNGSPEIFTNNYSTIKEVIGYKNINGFLTAEVQVNKIEKDYQDTSMEYWYSDSTKVILFAIPWTFSEYYAFPCYDKAIENDTSFTIIYSGLPYVIHYYVYHIQDTLWNKSIQMQIWQQQYEYTTKYNCISPGIGEVKYVSSSESVMGSSTRSHFLCGVTLNDSIYGAPAPPLSVWVESQDDSVKLSWNKSAEQNVIYYNIYGSPANNDLQFIKTTATNNDTICFITNLDKKYGFRISAVNDQSLESDLSRLVFFSPISAVSSSVNQQLSSYYLSQNYPNPFNNDCIIEYGIPFTSQVKISIYNIYGHEVKVLINEEKSPGKWLCKWDGTNNFNNKVASGLYYYKFEAGSFRKTCKMLLLR